MARAKARPRPAKPKSKPKRKPKPKPKRASAKPKPKRASAKPKATQRPKVRRSTERPVDLAALVRLVVEDDGAVVAGAAEPGPPAVMGVAVGIADGWLAAARIDGEVAMWSPIAGAALATTRGRHGARACCVIAVPGGGVASGGVDGAIRVWHRDPHGRAIAHHDSSVMCLAFAPSGELLVSGSEDRTIAIYDWAAGALAVRFAAHDGTVLSVDVSPDGRSLVSAGWDSEIRLWTIAGDHVATLPHGGYGSTWCARFLDDEHVIVARGSRASVWTPATGATELLHEEDDARYSIHSLAIRPDRAEVAMSHCDDVIVVGLADRSARLHRGHTGEVNSVAYLADHRLASGADDGSVRVWSAGGAPPLVLRR